MNLETFFIFYKKYQHDILKILPWPLFKAFRYFIYFMKFCNLGLFLKNKFLARLNSYTKILFIDNFTCFYHASKPFIDIYINYITLFGLSLYHFCVFFPFYYSFHILLKLIYLFSLAI